jgi:hypothetical protein
MWKLFAVLHNQSQIHLWVSYEEKKEKKFTLKIPKELLRSLIRF